MLNKSKLWIVIILLLSSVLLVFTMPKAKYVGTNFIAELKLPSSMEDWQGTDVTDNLNISYDTETDLSINNALAYNYEKKNMGNLIFIVLETGNFHYPKTCFTGAGFKIEDRKKTDFNASERIFQAHTIFIEKERKNESYLIFYWIVIDKKMIPNWAEQKIKQMFFSLFNKERTGLLIRLDIPVKKDNIQEGIILAKQFIGDISLGLPPDKADYIFGEKK